MLLNNHRAQRYWPGQYNFDEGFPLGILVGDGTLKEDKAVLSIWTGAMVANGAQAGVTCGTFAFMRAAEEAARKLPHRSDFQGFHEVSGRNEFRMAPAALRRLALEVGMQPGNKCITPTMERASSDFQRGFLRGLFDSDGSVQGTLQKGVSDVWRSRTVASAKGRAHAAALGRGRDDLPEQARSRQDAFAGWARKPGRVLDPGTA